ncbi:FAD-binding oxidoreductase [Kitasatospora aburaviensis]
MRSTIDETRRPAGQHGWHALTVSGLDRLTDDTVAITLAVPDRLAEAFSHRAGQHVVVRHRQGERELRRCYSVCPPPFDPGRLRLIVKRASPDGFGAYATTRLAVGTGCGSPRRPAPSGWPPHRSGTTCCWPAAPASPRCWRWPRPRCATTRAAASHCCTPPAAPARCCWPTSWPT